MNASLVRVLALAVLLSAACTARAQKAPEAGYVFPPGGKAGTTVEVRLGGYDWTPDMDFFTLDPRVKLIPSGPPGPILIPGPPYWFGARGRIVALPLPREVPAKFVLPADMPAGPVYWQAANANGCTSTGVFVIGTGPEVVEDERRKAPQPLPSLPVTVSGRLMKIAEVDQYRFTSPRDGPITCELMARRLGARFLGILEVRDREGRVIADASGTNGTDPSLTFAAKAGAEYVVSLHDVDFGGDRSYVYRLTVTPGPRVAGALPAAGRRGETREVEFVGVGVATGAAKLESVKRRVTFPATPTASAFDYRLETPWGEAPPFRLLLSDLPETVAPPGKSGEPSRTGNMVRLGSPDLPAGITGVLDGPDAEDHYSCAWKKGQVWSLSLEARRLASPLDVALTVLGPDGKELARNDDLPGTTDAGLEFTVPADGTYRIVVSDMAGKSGSRAAIYRLVVRPAASDFALQLPAQRISVPLGGKFDLPVKAVRTGGFQGSIALTVSGLPGGVSVPTNLVIPAGKTDLVVPLQAAKDVSPSATFVTVTGTGMVKRVRLARPGQTATRTALAPTTVNLAPRSPDEARLATLLVASVMQPRFKGRPVDQDTGRKVYRGTTFPAEVIVERLNGFDGEVVLQMAAQQSYQVQGITGGEVKVPPGVTRTIYPCFMPEWLETTRTSRMGMVGVARVADPKGRVRYLVGEITGFITMTLEGALMKVSADDADLVLPAGRPFDVRVKVSRLTKLAEPVRLELQLPEEVAGRLAADPVTVPVGKESAIVRITPAADLRGPCSFTIRGTALQDRRYPAVSEAAVSVEFLPPGAASR
jgi:hypothetical protein